MVKFSPIIIDLESRQDKLNQPIYLGRLQAPCRLSFKRGIIFLLFNSEPGYEELRIGIPKSNSNFGHVKKIHQDNSIKYHIDLQQCFDENGKVYYRSLVKDNLELDLSDGYLFFGFTSKVGFEKLQIVQNSSKE